MGLVSGGAIAVDAARLPAGALISCRASSPPRLLPPPLRRGHSFPLHAALRVEELNSPPLGDARKLKMDPDAQAAMAAMGGAGGESSP